MRSRNVSPGRAVMRTTIWSDSTRVPPVTAERSPPDSRITGADSPVMADSSTEAMPSMISPSDGIISPAVTTTTSSTPSCDDGTGSSEPSARRRLATVSDRALRRVSACALPRPSATASAKLANRTVNHSHAATRPANRFSFPVVSPSIRSRTKRIVVSDAADPHHEHDGVAHHQAGGELAEAVDRRRLHDRRVEQRAAGLGAWALGRDGRGRARAARGRRVLRWTS